MNTVMDKRPNNNTYLTKIFKYRKSLSHFVIWFCTFTFFSINSYGQLESNETEIIGSTNSGKISGYTDQGIYAFKGIPYGKSERFMPPKKSDKWRDTLECREYGPIAMQANNLPPNGKMAENGVLNLNLWTPALNDRQKRPVMVWLHGGGFSSGSSSMFTYFDGVSLASKGNVVVVTVNHRLNILGFLDLSACGKKYSMSGNLGMLDIVEALKWVHENIRNFGGDPENVTVFGQSGGGGKVSTLLCMPDAKGLFHKAIIQSGTIANTNTEETSQKLGIAVLEELGISAEQPDRISTISYNELVNAGEKALTKIVGERTPGKATTMFGFCPTPDDKVLLQHPFTPGFPAISDNVPIMVGTTFNEMMDKYYREKDLTIEQVRERLFEKYGSRTDDFMKAFAKAYPDYTLQDMLSIDEVFRPLTVSVANAVSSARKTPIYVYQFNWKSPLYGGFMGSVHGLEQPFVFNNISLAQMIADSSKETFELADKISSAWLNFAKTGNPNTEKLPAWPAYASEDGATMILDNNCVVKYNHDSDLISIMQKKSSRKSKSNNN